MENLVERRVEKEIIKWIDSKEILAIRGPRQSGKTTLLYKIMNFLKERGKERIHFQLNPALHQNKISRRHN